MAKLKRASRFNRRRGRYKRAPAKTDHGSMGAVLGARQLNAGCRGKSY